MTQFSAIHYRIILSDKTSIEKNCYAEISEDTPEIRAKLVEVYTTLAKLAYKNATSVIIDKVVEL